jgi:hypothetical protein
MSSKWGRVQHHYDIELWKAGQMQYVNYRQHPPFGFSVPFTLYFNSIYFQHNYTRNSYLLQLTFIKYTCVKTTRNRTLTFCFEKAKNIFLTPFKTRESKSWQSHFNHRII